MKKTAFLILLAIGLLYGCDKDKNIYPKAYSIVGPYSYRFYDTATQPVEFVDTMPVALGTLTYYTADSVGLSVNDWADSTVINWNGRLDANNYYYLQLDNLAGSPDHYHYYVLIYGDTMVYNYHARTGLVGSHYNDGGQIVYETITRYKGTIDR